MSVLAYLRYVRYEFARGVIDLGIALLPKGASKRELDQIIKAWQDFRTSRKFKEKLDRASKHEVATLIHKIANKRLDGLISDYESRFFQSAKKFIPCRYDYLLKNVSSDFFYSGYTLTDLEIKEVLKNLLDKKILMYNGDWDIVDPNDGKNLDDLISESEAANRSRISGET